jgi:hypothetical protein
VPLKNYDSSFGGKKGSARKAHAAMLKTYGKTGERVFYATANKRKAARKKG